jgi:hypothetical protein
MNVEGLKVVLVVRLGSRACHFRMNYAELASAGTMYSCREFTIEQGTRG